MEMPNKLDDRANEYYCAVCKEHKTGGARFTMVFNPTASTTLSIAACGSHSIGDVIKAVLEDKEAVK